VPLRTASVRASASGSQRNTAPAQRGRPRQYPSNRASSTSSGRKRTTRYGPVPTGPSFPRARAITSTMASWCSSSAAGSRVRSSTVRGPRTVTPSSAGATDRIQESGAERPRSRVKATSSAAKGRPSWKRTSGRSSSRKVRASGLVQEVASAGSSVPAASSRTSGS
jgi:hypothetical protein